MTGVPQLRFVLSKLYQRDVGVRKTLELLVEHAISVEEAAERTFGGGAAPSHEVYCFLLLVREGNKVVLDVVGGLVTKEREKKLYVDEAESVVFEEVKKSCRCAMESYVERSTGLKKILDLLRGDTDCLPEKLEA